jgi:fused signal recognition particle receptor
MFGLFEKIKKGLAKTRTAVMGRMDALLFGGGKIDAALLEEIEEILIAADVGMKMTTEIMTALEVRRRSGSLPDAAAVKEVIRGTIRARLLQVEENLHVTAPSGPYVIMVVGVNGVGKTTTIGKLAHRYLQAGRKVTLGAGDTFRAAAAEQLVIWGERAGVDVIRHADGADPAAVAFDAARAAIARKQDILIFDTAGRLHTKVHLMEELKKIRRIFGREIAGAPHETLLILDAATGQNALSQARLFREAVAVDGVVLTKLDGTARGGIVIAISSELGLPVRYIGIGEGLDDLRPFVADEFIDAIFAPEE